MTMLHGAPAVDVAVDLSGGGEAVQVEKHQDALVGKPVRVPGSGLKGGLWVVGYGATG